MADNCASLQSPEESVGGMALPLVKAELKSRGLPAKEKKTSLIRHLIVVLKQEEAKPSCSPNESSKSTAAVPTQVSPADKGSAVMTSETCRRSLPILS